MWVGGMNAKQIELTFEETLGFFGLEFQQLTSGTSDLGQDERDTLDLSLVMGIIFSSKLHVC